MNLFLGAISYLLKYINLFFKENIDILGVPTFLGTPKLIVWGLNRVEVGRHGLILKDNGAMASRTSGTPYNIKKRRLKSENHFLQNSYIFPYIFIY